MEDIKESDIDWEKTNKAKANPEAMEKMLLDAGWVSLDVLGGVILKALCRQTKCRLKML